MGYDWNDYASLEAGYNNFGEVDADTTLGTVEAEADGVELAFVFRWPLSDLFSLTGRAGYLWWDGETRAPGVSADDSGSDLLFGAGGEFHATDRFAITLGWSRYQLDDLDVDYAAIGIRLRFGGQN